MGKNELAKQLVDRISEQARLIEQLQAKAIKHEERIKDLKFKEKEMKKTRPRLGMRFINQWANDPDIEVCFLCLDVSLECGYPRIYVGFVGFLLEIGYEGYY